MPFVVMRLFWVILEFLHNENIGNNSNDDNEWCLPFLETFPLSNVEVAAAVCGLFYFIFLHAVVR